MFVTARAMELPGLCRRAALVSRMIAGDPAMEPARVPCALARQSSCRALTARERVLTHKPVSHVSRNMRCAQIYGTLLHFGLRGRAAVPILNWRAHARAGARRFRTPPAHFKIPIPHNHSGHTHLSAPGLHRFEGSSTCCGRRSTPSRCQSFVHITSTARRRWRASALRAKAPAHARG